MVKLLKMQDIKKTFYAHEMCRINIRILFKISKNNKLIEFCQKLKLTLFKWTIIPPIRDCRVVQSLYRIPSLQKP